MTHTTVKKNREFLHLTIQKLRITLLIYDFNRYFQPWYYPSYHYHHMLDPVLSPSTELAGFRMVIVFTAPRHFVRSHISSSPVYFSSSHSLIAFSTFVLVFLFLYYRSLQILNRSLSHSHLLTQNMTLPLHTTCFNHPI